MDTTVERVTSDPPARVLVRSLEVVVRTQGSSAVVVGGDVRSSEAFSNELAGPGDVVPPNQAFATSSAGEVVCTEPLWVV